MIFLGRGKNLRFVSLLVILLIMFQVAKSPVLVFASTGSDNNVSSKDKTNETSSSGKIISYLTANNKGQIIYHGDPIKLEDNKYLKSGDPLLVGRGNSSIPVPLVDLMKKGVQSKPKSKVGSVISNLALDFISPFRSLVANASNGVSIKYLGPVRYYYNGGYWSQTGEFEVNEHLAFCIQHTNATPATGTPYGPLNPYNNAKIARTLYYGWGGPGNIFTNKTQGIVITSLVVSRLYNGVSAGGESAPGYSELWDKAQNGSIPNNKGLHFSDSSLSVSVKNGKQVSQNTTLEAGSKNSLTVKVPSGITLVNNTTGKRVTNGSMTVYGGQTVHLESSLRESYSYKTGSLHGKLARFQPLITIPDSKGYQSLAYGHWYSDPNDVTSFKAKFFPRTADLTLRYKDNNSGKILKTTELGQYTIGQTYNIYAASTFSKNGTEYKVAENKHRSGRMPDHNLTITVPYTPYNNITLRHQDDHSKKILQTVSLGQYQVGKHYDIYAAKSLTRGNTWYGIAENRHLSGIMPYRDIMLTVPYTPFQHVRVYWKNQYSPFTVFKQRNNTYSVGSRFNYTPNLYFNSGGNRYDRNSSAAYSSTVPYNDLSHTFYYSLRRTVTVNYYDLRTGQKIKSSKSYTLHQGDRYSESHPTIKSGEYTYRYVKETRSPQAGTVGTGNITINYYYTIPLAKVGLKKLQIYTAKNTEGLPVKVYLDKVSNYGSSVPDMNNSNEAISVSLYQGSTRYATKKFTADQFPTYLSFKIPPSKLQVNKHKPYTVKIEGYNQNDFKVAAGHGRLKTNGYTSSEETFHVDVSKTQQLKKSQVIMTEITPTTSEKDYDETFDYTFTKAPMMKTGYGFENNISLTYTNELGQALQVKKMTYQVPKKLIDSYLSYPVNSNQALIPMDEGKSTTTAGNNVITTVAYNMPHVNVERETGYLFSDAEKKKGDSKITKPLIDGGHKFYLPIWMDLGNYGVSSVSNNIGVNQISVVASDTINVTAHMIATMDSTTIEKDEILMMPVNPDNPFPDGLPKGWTTADVKWIQKG